MKDRMKKLREALNLSQKEFASGLKLKDTAISKYETGLVKPGADVLSKIGETYKVNLNWLITGDGDMFSFSSDTEIIKIPERGEIECAAGNGCNIYNEEITGYFSMDKQKLKEFNANISSCSMVKVKGDSMYPTLNTGDKILVDTSQKDIIDGKIYIIRIEDMLKVKRLHKLIRGRIEVISDNKEYGKETLEPEKDNFEVCGRVLWHLIYI